LGPLDIFSINPNDVLENIENDIGELIKQVYAKSVRIVNKKNT